MSHRLHVPPERIAGDEARVDAAGARHLEVLRLGPGAGVEVFDGTGRAWEGVLERLSPEGAVVRLGAPRALGLPPPFVLVQGLAKGERMDLVMQKAVELGVTELRPAACARSVVHLDAARGARKADRWQKIAAEAARQCGRADVPTVHPPAALGEVLREVGAREDLARMVAWEEERSLGLSAFLRAHPAAGHALVVGPEGGLTAEEVQAAQAAGFVSVSLGPRILRTETVGLVVLSIVRFTQGELG